MEMIDVYKMIPESELLSGDSEVGLDLVELALEARKFLSAHSWCGGIKSIRYDRGFPKVAVFYSEIEPLRGADPDCWVIVGDVPPLYIDTIGHSNGAEALAGYILVYFCMLALYKRGEPLDEEPPVYERGSLTALTMDDELAAMLGSRLKFIRDRILEFWPDEIRYDISDIDESHVDQYLQTV